MDSRGRTIRVVTDTTILTDEELASIRRPYRGARLLPRRAYHDEAIHAWERERFLRHDWVVVGREADAPTSGTYFTTELDGEPLLVVRGRDDQLRAFYNVCQHRGTAVVEEPCGTAVRFQCPYHAWIYDLEGNLIRAKHTEDLEEFSLGEYGLNAVRLETWQGFVFLNLDPEAAPLADQLGDLIERFARFDFAALRSVRTISYDVAANWKFVAENYSECYHCPGLHPQLNKLTPYDVGAEYEPSGAWQGGWMELIAGAETMALDGGLGSRRGRLLMTGITAQDERRIDYYIVWPTTFLSIHPDYLLVHRLTPDGPSRTKILCEFLFPEATMAMPEFDASDAIAFWDLTNTQDWHVCELQQRGTASRSWVSGRYSNLEESVHAFDQMVADRYAGDGFVSQRTLLQRRETSAKGGAGAASPEASANGHHGSGGTDRAAARASARAKATARARATSGTTEG
jgi:Rieske 2Fe-2S family protein